MDLITTINIDRDLVWLEDINGEDSNFEEISVIGVYILKRNPNIIFELDLEGWRKLRVYDETTGEILTPSYHIE